jgi:hypothetical protein
MQVQLAWRQPPRPHQHQVLLREAPLFDCSCSTFAASTYLSELPTPHLFCIYLICSHDHHHHDLVMIMVQHRTALVGPDRDDGGGEAHRACRQPGSAGSRSRALSRVMHARAGGGHATACRVPDSAIRGFSRASTGWQKQTLRQLAVF